MPGPFFVLFRDPISEQDLSEFTLALKGTITSYATLNNVLSDGHKHEWFSLNKTSELEAVKERFKNGALTNTRTATLSDPNNPLSLTSQTDTVNFNGDITFALNANLNVDLQNDVPLPGADAVHVAGGARALAEA